MSPQDLLRHLFDRAVAAADPMLTVPVALPPKPPGRVVVIGAGKASARMAEAVEHVWGQCDGLVLTRYGHARPCQGVEIVEAAHPVPNAAGMEGTARMLDLLATLDEDAFVLSLISGGGSALLSAPAEPITLAEKQAINATLLASGAPIDQMNIVRKHLSRVKGGQLAAAAFPAQMLSLMISDVPGDRPQDIASGPTVGEASTAADARLILERYDIDMPQSVHQVLSGPSRVIRPGDPRLLRVENRVISAPAQSLAAAAEAGRAAGCEVRILGDTLQGEARELGAAHAKLALTEQSRRAPGAPPLLMLSGGECTVSGRGGGVGGPNAEYALSSLIALDAAHGIHLIACDTDGVDGAADVAGATVSPESRAQAQRLGANPADHLARNDAHSFFAKIGGQIVTGPTLTNVNDFRALLTEAL